MAVNGAKDWAFVLVEDTQPRRQRGDWAMAGSTKRNADLAALPHLIGFGAAQVQHSPFPDLFDIIQIKSNQLGGSKTTCPPDQQQGPIPEGAGIVPKRVQQDEQVFAQKRTARRRRRRASRVSRVAMQSSTSTSASGAKMSANS